MSPLSFFPQVSRCSLHFSFFLSLFLSLFRPIPSSFLPIFPSSLVSRKYVSAHARSALSLRFVSLSYHYFLPALINCPFFVDFPCFMRPTSAINVTSPIPFPLHFPPSVPSFHDHLSGIRDFRCQKHILSQPVINERPYPRNSGLSYSSFSESFFLFQK